MFCEPVDPNTRTSRQEVSREEYYGGVVNDRERNLPENVALDDGYKHETVEITEGCVGTLTYSEQVEENIHSYQL